MSRREIVDVAAFEIGPSKHARHVRKGRRIANRTLVKQAVKALREQGVIR